MGTNLVYKILKAHLKDGKLEPGTEIGIRIDQTLTQDATGTMAYLQFEAMGMNEIKTDLSVAYPIMTSLGFVIVVLVSWLFLKETITLIQFTGLALIIAGVWMVAR